MDAVHRLTTYQGPVPRVWCRRVPQERGQQGAEREKAWCWKQTSEQGQATSQKVGDADGGTDKEVVRPQNLPKEFSPARTCGCPQ